MDIMLPGWKPLVAQTKEITKQSVNETFSQKLNFNNAVELLSKS